MPRLMLLCVIVSSATFLASLTQPTIPAKAQSPTGYEVDETFQGFYNRSGGLPVFGYAVTGPAIVYGRLVQYFERQRFEHHPEHAETPYEVQLGRLGFEEAEYRGLLSHEAFQPRNGPGSSNDDCRYFGETGHYVCRGFLQYWDRHGLDFGDPGVSFRESVALFGYPISEEFVDPDTGLVTQYFERARFEFHPELSGTPFEILLGHVGYSRLGEFIASVPEHSLSSLIQSAQPGDTVIVPPGIYREQVVIDKPLTLIAAPGAEVRGSDVWSSWHNSGAYWQSHLSVPAFDNTYGFCAVDDLCKRQEQVFIDGHQLIQVGSNPAPGQFAINSNRHVVLGEDPTGRTVEVSVREHWVVGQSADVTIEGFTMRHAANTAQTGALTNGGYDNWTIRNNTLSYAHGANVSLTRGTNLHLLNNEISHGGQLGVHGGGKWWEDKKELARTITIDGNRIHGNNTAGYDIFWDAGGLKITAAIGISMTNNHVYNNAGSGLWCDIGCQDVVFRNNRIHDNSSSGIYFELGNGAEIAHNVIYNNLPHEWGAGILLHKSSNATVHTNIVAWNGHGIKVVSEDRGEAHWNQIVNNHVHDNVIAMAAIQGDEIAMGWTEYWDGHLTDPESNNRGANNRYYHAAPEHASYRPFRWGDQQFDWGSLSQFNQTPGEHDGVYLTASQITELLASAGVPTHP